MPSQQTLRASATGYPYQSLAGLIIDPGYIPSMSIIPAVQLVRASSQYLSLSGSTVNSGGVMDFATASGVYPANQFTIEITRNPRSNSTDRDYIGKGQYNGGGSQYCWMLRTGGTANSQDQIKLFWYAVTANNANIYSMQTTDLPANWSRCVIVIDLTGTGGSMLCYPDGSTTAATVGGGGTNKPAGAATLPTGQGGNIQVGSINGLASNYDGYLGNLRIWRAALTANQIAVLNRNGGFPVAYKNLPATLKSFLVADWSMQDAAGAAKVDATGIAGNLAEVNGPIASGSLCASIIDQSSSIQFNAQTFGYCPPWGVSPLNGMYGLEFKGQHWMWAGGTDSFTTGVRTADIFSLVYPTDLSAANFDYAILSSAKETYNNNLSYMFPLIYNSKAELRMRSTVSGINNDPRGTTALSANNGYLINQRCFGTGDTGAGESFEFRLNAASNPLDTAYSGYSSNSGSPWNRCYGDMDAHNGLTLGGLNYAVGSTPRELGYDIQDRFVGWINRVMIYRGYSNGNPGTGATSLTQSQNRDVESQLKSLAWL